ncbi:MAG: FtsW/RodA/SpoVE family cell cycle protein [Lachnospiraceae bacterium]|nr:FtsW/RodA/SpoVE family cell cycle protein [Lachnospiraceae bacterium]
MNTVITALSRYALPFFMAFYAFNSFAAAGVRPDERKGFYIMQNIFMVLIHVLGYFVLSLEKDNMQLMVLCALQEILFFAVILIYRLVYKRAVLLVTNNMCLFLAVSFVILTRLSPEKAVKQFFIVAVSLVLTSLIPLFTKRLKLLKRYALIPGIAGAVVLFIVFIAGAVTFGSKISYTIFGITFQPSEFIKLSFILSMAGILSPTDEEEEDEYFDYTRYTPELKNILISAAIAAVHVVILVISRDLGAALIFFIMYIAIIFVSTHNPLYVGAGALAGSFGAVLGYKLFSHVRTRVIAWRDPYSVIDGQGYQIAQSLFAIGTGSWFGMGLTKGSPNKIPVVEADFVFSAIGEEFGAIFGICLILVCISTFLMFMNTAMRCSDIFFRLLTLGCAVNYGFQILLNVGGATKFIPLTGVTLPLISYGGSSMLVTLTMFALVQGVCLIKK